ncbi:MAG: hypothetical protein HYZ89_02740 [Candidatus Omnitrophica bacterium]|nr:hypothetical protein [Candidatus Omnitrophota bacterium]
MEDDRYDVAISFLSKDQHIARELSGHLSQNFHVFVSFNEQESLAGTDGIESFRQVFREQARLVVVLYREGWGETPLTGVEEVAIKDRCMSTKKGWDTLLFIMINEADEPPVWLPESRIRLNLWQYGIEQAVGAIKSRIESLGGEFREEDPVDSAKRLERKMAFRENKRRLFTCDEGVQEAARQAEEVHGHIRRLVEQIRVSLTHLKLEAGSDRDCTVVTTGRVSLTAYWYPAYSNSLENSPFIVKEFNGRVLLPEQRGKCFVPVKAEQLAEHEFDPDLTPEQRWCWYSRFAPPRHFTSAEVAKFCIDRMLELVERADKGNIPRPDPLEDQGRIVHEYEPYA